MIGLLIKSSLLIAVLWGFYRVILARESFFAANRWYLVLSLGLVFMLPFVSFPSLIDQQGMMSRWIEGEKMVQVQEPQVVAAPNLSVVPDLSQDIIEEDTSSEAVIPMPSPTVTPSTPDSTGKGWVYWLIRLYLFGVVIFSLNLLTQIGGIIWKIIRNKDRIKSPHYTLINLPQPSEPCSFFRYIFIHPDSYDFETYEQIIAHEAIHVRKWHTLDLLLAEVVAIVLWFHPLAWIYRREVEQNIEYQTDELLVKKENVEKSQYQMNLLKVATYRQPLAITTNYNQSLIKKRILRMSAKKSNPHNFWKYTFLLPVLFMTILFMNKPYISV
ncbi:MAG: M56 family metallopeptidase, partial [Bacteroidota bacterium]